MGRRRRRPASSGAAALHPRPYLGGGSTSLLAQIRYRHSARSGRTGRSIHLAAQFRMSPTLLGEVRPDALRRGRADPSKVGRTPTYLVPGWEIGRDPTRSRGDPPGGGRTRTRLSASKRGPNAKTESAAQAAWSCLDSVLFVVDPPARKKCWRTPQMANVGCPILMARCMDHRTASWAGGAALRNTSRTHISNMAGCFGRAATTLGDLVTTACAICAAHGARL